MQQPWRDVTIATTSCVLSHWCPQTHRQKKRFFLLSGKIQWFVAF